MTYPLCHLALFQPDIAQNTGAVMRLASCFDLRLEIIEPCGFLFTEKSLKRVVMDYTQGLDYQRHADWNHFKDWRGRAENKNKRLILFSTKAALCYDRFVFQKGDILIFGSESAGVPREILAHIDAAVTIPMKTGARSLNLAMSVAIAAGHVRMQLNRAN